MSSKTYDNALDFMPAKAGRSSGAWAAIVSTFSAIREGIDLAGQYKELTARGMASEVAARKVFEQIGKN